MEKPSDNGGWVIGWLRVAALQEQATERRKNRSNRFVIIRSTLMIPHSIESNQSATHPKLNVYARDFQPSIPGSQNIDDQNTEIRTPYEECNLDSNDLKYHKE